MTTIIIKSTVFITFSPTIGCRFVTNFAVEFTDAPGSIPTLCTVC